MKKIFFTAIIIALSVTTIHAQAGQTCDPAKEKSTKKNSTSTKAGGFGVAITKDGAIDVKLLADKMKSEKELFVKIKGDVITACQVKGCWMTADLGDGKSMRMRFKDYVFFVPKDSGGKQFYAQGIASWSETSVAELQHYAEDAGKSKAEIEKITAPTKELVFLAEGVLLEKK